MSTSPDSDFDLEKLLLPDWARESPQQNRFAKFEGEPERERRGDRGDRGHRRDRPPRRPDFGGPRGPSSPSGARGPERGDRPRAPREGGRPPRRGERRLDRRPEGQRPLPAPVPLPEIAVAFTPEDHAVDLLTKQIRVTGRAFPLFDIAQLILQKPERHSVTLSVKKKYGVTAQPLFICAMDESLWLSEDAAVRYVLDKYFSTFYQAERTKIDPPKGVYTFVAQCGMSGVVLGPPNYHDYQNQLRKLHGERFARMPFDAFKARVKIVKDEDVVKKWVEEQSWKTEFNCLNLPEPLKLPSMEEVEKHFRATHLPNIIKPVETQRLTGVAGRNLRDRELLRLLRVRWEEQKRFPLQIATTLSQQFAARGLQFFKVNRTVTHVAVARPHFLDLEATPVSDSVKRIVEFINANPKCTHKQLLQTLAPAPPAPVPVAPPPAPAEAAPAAEAGAAPAETAPAPAPATAESTPEPTPEMAAVMTDLHWLIHQGHVIEFANGVLETAKKPIIKPPKPAKSETPLTAPEGVAAPQAVPDGAVTGAADPSTAAETVAPDNLPSAAEVATNEAAAGVPVQTAPAGEAQPAS